MRTVSLLLVLLPCLCWSQLSPEANPAESQCQCPSQPADKDGTLVLSLSGKQMRSHLLHVVPLGVGETHVKISGTLVLRVKFQPDGTVSCVQGLSGNPLALASAMEVVPKWTFSAVEKKHKKYGGCGLLKVRYDLSDSKRETSVQ